PMVRVVRKATMEEKQSLIDRQPQQQDDHRLRPVHTNNVKIRQTVGSFRRAALSGGIRLNMRGMTPSAARAAEEAKAKAAKAAEEAALQAKAAEEARLQAEAKAAEEAKAAAKAAEEAKAASQSQPKPKSEDSRQADKGRRQRSSKRSGDFAMDDEINDKDLLDMPIISAEEMGIQQDESISLSTPLTPISVEDAFSTDFASHAQSIVQGHRSKNSRQADKMQSMRNEKLKGKNQSGSRGGNQNKLRGGNAGRGQQQGGKNQNLGRGQQQAKGQNGRPQGRGPQSRAGAAHQQPAVVPQEKTIIIPEVISLADLASRMGRPATSLIFDLARQGRMVTINQAMSYEEARDLALQYGYKVGDMASEDIPLELIDEEINEVLTPRPPVVSVLGHVDHGKTSLLDAIRRTSVTAGEAGGITQRIGAYTVEHDGQAITFIDTPGHEAFTQMRARGASITDIAILVVAADDGVMPQTVEAINHARAAKLPIIVAINKVDLPNANPEKVMQQLTEYNLVAEEWGGDTTMCKVSAKKNLNLDELLDIVLLQAAILELKANPNKRAQGTIIEGSTETGKGSVATVLVQNGTLKKGDFVVVGNTWGHLRKLTNQKGKEIKEAGPSIPVEISGLDSVPNAGDHLQVVESDKIARQISAARTAQARRTRINAGSKQTLESLFADIKNGTTKKLNLLVKAEAHGSMQALVQSLNKLSTDEVAVKIFHSGVGAISESDVMLASASNAIIIGFNVRPDAKVKRLADIEEVEIRTYRIIYDVIEQIKKAMSGLLTPDIEEVALGRIEARQIFKISKVGKVAGCFVVEGKAVRGALARLIRDNTVIYESSIETLRRFKDDAREVGEGFECGLTMANYQDIQEGDIIECYQKVEHQREL
ncbi:translation initiation factor IF-2, partial [bacterium]|nr:translation initiation factor IF-2 [bacterium]